MFKQKLEVLFAGLLGKIETGQTVSFADLQLGEDFLPLPLKAHLQNNDTLLTIFPENYQYQTTTQMLLDRLRSSLNAFKSLKPDLVNQLTTKQQLFEEHIQQQFDIDDLKNKTKNKRRFLKSLKDLLERYNDYINKTVLLEFAQLHYGNQVTVRFDDTNYRNFLEELRKAEIEAISQAGRQSFINIDHNGYFTAEIPLGMTEDGHPYTHQSYKRDTTELSNYVLHVMGYRDSDGKITILNHCTRAANYMPINLPGSRVAKLKATMAQVKQRHESVKTLNPDARTFSQISLLSPLAEGPNIIDEQHGHEQTLLTYLAFLLQNQSADSMHMRYFVEGVNQMRSFAMSHPLRSQINIRFYNQLMADLKIQSSFCNKIFSFDALENKVKDSWQQIAICIQNLAKHLQQQFFDDNDLEGFIQTFEIMLDHHRELEKDLYDKRMKAWDEHKKEITRFLNSNGINSEEYNLIQEFNNLHFLRENHRYQDRQYNYQLQACVHRLTASLGHEVGVNCNDSEDRTGFENVMVMASYQSMHQNNHQTPQLEQAQTLKNIQSLASSQQMKDVGINNTAANGSAGQEINPEDVADGLVDPYANQVAKLTKSIYRPILKDDSWLERLKRLSPGEIITAVGDFIQQKFRVNKWIKKAGIAAAAAFMTIVGTATSHPSSDSMNFTPTAPQISKIDPASSTKKDDDSAPISTDKKKDEPFRNTRDDSMSFAVLRTNEPKKKTKLSDNPNGFFKKVSEMNREEKKAYYLTRLHSLGAPATGRSYFINNNSKFESDEFSDHFSDFANASKSILGR